MADSYPFRWYLRGITNSIKSEIRADKELTSIKTRKRWFSIYFPEYSKHIGSFETTSSIMI